MACARAGATSVLTVPVVIDALRSRIREAIELRAPSAIASMAASARNL
jgi:hypothetical protein